MNGQTGGTVDRIADNAWLKMIERLAVPLIGLIAWQMYTDVGDIKEQQPVIIERVKNLELRADKMEQRADSARADRIGQYQSMIVELTALKSQVQILDATISEQKSLLRDINQKLSANPGGRAK